MFVWPCARSILFCQRHIRFPPFNCERISSFLKFNNLKTITNNYIRRKNSRITSWFLYFARIMDDLRWDL